jgi:hypothetical protein
MLRNDLAHGVVNDTLAAASPIVHCLKPHTQGYVYLSTGSGTWCAEIMVVGCVGWEGVEKKQVPPPEGPLSMRQESFESGRPWFAIPPGKGNGREHQDLRRRHLLVRDRQRPPHFDTSPRSGRYESFRRTFECFINPTLAFFDRASFRRVWSDSHAHSHAPAVGDNRRRAQGRDVA